MNKIICWLAVVLVAGAIFALSAQPYSHAFTAEIFGPYNHLARKAAHFTEYALLCMALRTALALTLERRKRPSAATSLALSLGTLILCVLFAFSDEWHQSFVPGRTPSRTDVLLDSCGAFFGALVFWVGSKFAAGKRNREGR